MNNILKRVFSMGLMALALFAFFVAIAKATVIENDFGTPVAQKLVYKANWFSLILLYLAFSLIYNIYRYKFLQWKKLSSLTFHVAFIVILIGAAFTRYFGFEGAMVIPENASSNEIISTETYIHWHVDDGETQYEIEYPVILEGATHNYFYEEVDFPGQEETCSIEFLSLIENVKDTLIPVAPKFGDPYLEIVIPGERGREYYYIKSGEKLADLGFKLAFNSNEETDVIRVQNTDSGLYFISPYDLTYFQMADKSEGLILRDSLQPFVPKRLYNSGTFQFVFNVFYPGGKLETISAKEGTDLKEVTVLLAQGGVVDTLAVRGGKGIPMIQTEKKFKGLNHRFGYGSTITRLPFYIYLDDFNIERYPGTDKPSSFSSFVTLVDPEKGSEESHHIFMNNVLDYSGYRIFQSSYNEGKTTSTILSVNQDSLGTTTTYIGYFLLGLGFILNLFSPTSRFRKLIQKTSESIIKLDNLKVLLVAFFLGVGGVSYGQDIINHDHAEAYGHLVVQDFEGRFKPVQTVANEVLRKVSRQTSFGEYSDMQVFLGIHTNLMFWNKQELVYASGAGVRKKIGIDEGQRRTSIRQFFNDDFSYKLEDDVSIAMQKKPSSQSQYDKDILKTDERVNVLLGVMGGAWLKIMPLPNDSSDTWYSPFDETAPFTDMDKLLFENLVPWYNNSVQKGFQTGDWTSADSVVYMIDTYQRKVAPEEILPSREDIELEIAYNNLDIFNKIKSPYLLIGFLFLLLNFLKLFIPRLNIKWFNIFGAIVFVLIFLAHGAGLGIRWYISGHAPWSDGYEALVFIGWVIGLAGIIFMRLTKIILGAAGILIWLVLFVSGMSQMNPHITPLVPVLKSYWLKIHVAIITGSYAFLGLAAILGLLSMFMYLFINKKNSKRVVLTLSVLTYLSEILIIIGLFMLTIGTFLGGVWANESWGRYWGWDAKETWALASVLVYSMILHFRFIPYIKSKFVFCASALVGYGSIIMTFFGVNFYLSGLHSYATGDPVPIPTWVPVTIAILLLLILLAFWRKTVVLGTSLNREKKSDK